MKLWLNNTIEDRLYMLQKAAKDHPGINQLAIEKDWWVMVTLKALFRTTCADSLIFKGGTSLSKGFQIIERFSEDIDLAISHSFFGIDKTSKSQREKLRKMARVFVHDTLSSELDARLWLTEVCMMPSWSIGVRTMRWNMLIMTSTILGRFLSCHLPVCKNYGLRTMLT